MYLRFSVDGKLYEFNALPMGLKVFIYLYIYIFIYCIVYDCAVQSQNLLTPDQIYVAIFQETGHTGENNIFTYI